MDSSITIGLTSVGEEYEGIELETPQVSITDNSAEILRNCEFKSKLENSDPISGNSIRVSPPSNDHNVCESYTNDQCLLTEDQVWSFLDKHPQLIDKWLKQKLSDELQMGRGLILRGLSDVHCKAGDLSTCPSGTETPSPSPDQQHHLSLNYCSTRSNSICSWKSPKTRTRNGGTPSRKVERLSEPELFMELIRDISTELDIDTLCHKILVNVGHLTHADRASLFLAQGSKSNKYLVAKLFDVTVDSPLEQALTNAREKEIFLPWGVGIVGHVASTKEVINIKDAYQDPRFNSSIDQQTGYKTMSVLCMPVCNFEGEVIGVAEIINKKNGTNEFTTQDVEVFKRYLAFCGIGIQNAQLFDMSIREYKRNQMLLQLARGIFEEQTSLERLVTKIMTDSRELLKCERCAVYLLDTEPHNKQEPITSASNLLCSMDSITEKPVLIRSESQSSDLSEQDESAIDARQSDIPSPKYVLQRKRQNLSFYTAFELRSSSSDYQIIRPTSSQLATSSHVALAKYVCSVGKTINISDVQGWIGSPLEDEGLLTFSVLTVPIFNSNKQILGVAQMINKENGLHFTEYDISTFEAFATFCGLGIQNTQVYEKACRLMARQQVALECLSYHATASADSTEALVKSEIPPASYFNLFSYDFNDFSLSDEDTCRCTIRMFMELNLIDRFNIPYDVLCRWTLSVKKNYRPVKYHNWRHAITVCQTMFAILKTGKMEQFMTDLEMLGLLVACLSHDLDHRGTNNSFQTKTDSPLAILYTTSTMEHHHFDQCVMILSQDQNNIFQSLSAVDYRKVMRVVENSILSTDMGLYFKKKDTFLELSDNGEFDWQSPDKKELLCGMMMTACDVSAIAKPWEVQHKVAKLVADEFFEQGDLERLKLNQEPVAMMDREKKDELPKMQVGFINYICLPLYKALSESFPWVKPLYDGCAKNREHWERLSEQVDMGLTWIDHEVIEKPVEKDKAEVISQITLNQKSLAAAVPTANKSQMSTTQSCDKDLKNRKTLGSALRSRSLKAGTKRRSVEKRLDRVVDSSLNNRRLTRDNSIDDERLSPQRLPQKITKSKKACTLL